MDLRQLEYVVAIAETGSFTAAAKRCHMTQSALSHQVASLERELGAPLFDRTSRPVGTTEAGRSLLTVARRVLRDMAVVRAELRAMDGAVRGPLRVGSTQTGVRLFDLGRLLADFRAKYSDVECALTLGPGWELFAGLRSGEFDVVFAAVDGDVGDGLACASPDRVEPLVAVVPSDHPLACRETVWLHELAGTGRFIDFRVGTALWKKLRVMSDAAGVQRAVMCELGSISDMVRLAATGAGVTVVPEAFTRGTEGQPGPPAGFRALPLADPDSSLTMGMFYGDGDGDGSGSALVREFAALLLR